MADQNLDRFALYGDNIYFVVRDEAVTTVPGSTANYYIAINKAVTAVLWGGFQDSDITAGDRDSDSSSYSLINSRYHTGLVHAVLAELPIETQNYHEQRYLQTVNRIKANQNILKSKRRVKIWDY